MTQGAITAWAKKAIKSIKNPWKIENKNSVLVITIPIMYQLVYYKPERSCWEFSWLKQNITKQRMRSSLCWQVQPTLSGLAERSESKTQRVSWLKSKKRKFDTTMQTSSSSYKLVFWIRMNLVFINSNLVLINSNLFFINSNLVFINNDLVSKQFGYSWESSSNDSCFIIKLYPNYGKTFR